MNWIVCELHLNKAVQIFIHITYKSVFVRGTVPTDYVKLLRLNLKFTCKKIKGYFNQYFSCYHIFKIILALFKELPIENFKILIHEQTQYWYH